MFDPDHVYLAYELYTDNAPYFTSHSDMPGIVELHIPGEDRTIKLSAAFAENLIDNLTVNTEAARAFART